MKKKLEKYSYRSGEELLSKNVQVREEIESILFQHGSGILALSGDEYADTIRYGFIQSRWENMPTVMDGHDLIVAMDFRKDRIGIRLGIESKSSPDDMQKFQIARKHPKTEIDVGVYLAVTAEYQQFLQQTSCKSWAGPNFDIATKKLRQMRQSLLVPICVLGIEQREAPLKSIDLDTMSRSVIRDLGLAFLESEYDGVPIIKNARVEGKTEVLEFDGITRLDGRDVILALEIDGALGALTPWLDPDRVHRLTDQVREYQEISQRDVCLRFVLIGDFNISFVDKAFGSVGIVPTMAKGITADYEVRTFEEFERFLAKHY